MAVSSVRYLSHCILAAYLLMSVTAIDLSHDHHSYNGPCNLASVKEFSHAIAASSGQVTAIEAVIASAICAPSADNERTRSQAACSIARLLSSHSHTNASIPTYLDHTSLQYVNRTEENWSVNCWQGAACILSPVDAAGVAQGLRIVTFLRSKFSVRSGGHNYNVNSSSVDDSGLLIDTVNLDSVALAVDRQTVQIGPSARFGQIYDTLNPYGVSINGARAFQPAAGGAYLGGGSGWFTNKYGVAAAGLRSAQVVLANSSIVECDRQHHKDLFWAIKGGGPNYGIVTRYTVNTIPVKQVWFESRLYNPEQTQDLLEATLEWQALAPLDGDANLVVELTSGLSFVGFIYGKPRVRPAIFSRFYDIPFNRTATNSTIGSMYDLSSSYATLSDGGDQPLNHLAVSVAHIPNADVYRESLDQFMNISRLYPSFQGALSYGIQTITPGAVSANDASGGTPLDLSNQTQNWFVGTLQWDSSSDAAAALGCIQAIGDAVRTAAQRQGALLPFQFMNDANSNQNVFAGYGNASVERLRSVSRSYDPTQAFQRLQNGGWLLSRYV